MGKEGTRKEEMVIKNKCGGLIGTMERGHEEVGLKAYLDPKGMAVGMAGKSNHKWGLFKESCCSNFQWTVSQAERKG